MDSEKRIAVFKELEAAKKRLEEPTFFQKSRVLGYVAGIILTFFGIYILALIIENISKQGVSLLNIAMLFLGLVFACSQWYFIARHNFNKRLLLVYEALLSNRPDDSNFAGQPLIPQQGSPRPRRKRRVRGR